MIVIVWGMHKKRFHFNK